MSDLISFDNKLLANNYFNKLPVNSGFSFDSFPYIKPETNQWDFEIAQSNNSTNIELAKIFERVNRENNKVQKIQASVHAFMKNMETTPGAIKRRLVVRDEEERFLFWKRNPVMFEIEITNEF